MTAALESLTAHDLVTGLASVVNFVILVSLWASYRRFSTNTRRNVAFMLDILKQTQAYNEMMAQRNPGSVTREMIEAARLEQQQKKGECP